MEDKILELEVSLAHLERTVEEQNAEILRLFRLLETAQRRLEKLEAQWAELSGGGSDRLNQHEKPPHY